MGNKKRKNTTSFLAQGTILAAASLISRVIGLIYRMPLTAIIGDTGNDYYGSAYTIYNILLIISSYSLPLAVSKLVSANISQGRRRNVYRILKCALIFALVSGTAAAAILYFGADFITGTLLRTPLCIFALKVLVPVLVIVAVLGVMRGFFQGLGTMMPSAVSQILEQIRVYAIEKNPEGVKLIDQNRKKFRTDGVRIIEGFAPQALEELETPTHAFIGGSSGNLREIVQLLQRKNPDVRIVINAISLETVSEVMGLVEEGILPDAEILQVSAARSKVLGRYHMMMGQNPVYIISAGGRKPAQV